MEVAYPAVLVEINDDGDVIGAIIIQNEAEARKAAANRIGYDLVDCPEEEHRFFSEDAIGVEADGEDGWDGSIVLLSAGSI